MAPSGKTYSIVIGGFGAAGAALALALLSGGVPASEILIADSGAEPGAPVKGPDVRILALNAGSRAFLAALGAWDRLSADAHPMHSMVISDTALDEVMRPRLLGMGAGEDDIPQEAPLAHLVPLGLIMDTLVDLCTRSGIAIRRVRISAIETGIDSVRVTMGEEVVAARLLVAADGARSPIRSLVGIPTHGWAYGQTAIVVTIRHSLPHRGEAVQHFLPAGPFAILPLDEHRSSIVWSEKTAEARSILSADSETQRSAIAERAAGWRGDVLGIEAISSHPLQLRLARRFFAGRTALVADAAHVVHPLAGQGLNLGFEDCAMLAELVVERLRLGLDPGATDLLEAYQARRRPAAAAMAYATEGINRLFSNDRSPLRLLRDVGAGIIERLPGAKRRLIHAASGQTSAAPRLFRGEAI